MQARRSFLVLLFSALLLLASPAFSAGGSAPNDEGVSPGCEAAIDKAAGRYSQCLLKASARHAKRGTKARLLAQQTRCENKFDAQVARIEDRFGEDQCTPLVSQIKDRTARYADNAAAEAGGIPARSYLFVQQGAGGTVSESTLTLSGISSQTGWFTDRPYRSAGQGATEEFISRLWDDGDDSFGDNPPNAEFTCTIDGEPVNYAVELASPRLEGGDLTYSARAIGEGAPLSQASCESDSQLFLDAEGWLGLCTQDSDCNSGNCTLPDNGVSSCTYKFGTPLGVVGPNCTTDSDCDEFTQGVNEDGFDGSAECTPAWAFCSELTGFDFLFYCVCNAFPK